MTTQLAIALAGVLGFLAILITPFVVSDREKKKHDQALALSRLGSSIADFPRPAEGSASRDGIDVTQRISTSSHPHGKYAVSASVTADNDLVIELSSGLKALVPARKIKVLESYRGSPPRAELTPDGTRLRFTDLNVDIDLPLLLRHAIES